MSVRSRRRRRSANDRRFDPGDLKHGIDFAGIQRLEEVRATDPKQLRIAGIDAAVLQQCRASARVPLPSTPTTSR